MNCEESLSAWVVMVQVCSRLLNWYDLTIQRKDNPIIGKEGRGQD
jgi:hypothetical protein